MKIIGIDPGIAIVGYGVIDYSAGRLKTLDYGVIRTPANTNVPDRLVTIYSKLDELIKLHSPDDMAVEQLFFNTNQKTAISVAEARGVILLCAKHNNLDLYEYTPLQVKQTVVGYGRAEKNQVIAMVTSILALKRPPQPDDAADALAIAICRAHSGGSQIEQYLRKNNLSR